MPGTTVLATLIVLAAVAIAGGSSVDGPQQAGRCHSALGMEEGRIPDSAVSASSSYEAKSVGPQNARVRQEKNGGAWCPKAQISSEVQEFLEVDLGKPHLITATETQGRFGNGQGQEYAESFHLLYWRDTLQRWATYKDAQGRKVLAGNRNTYLAVRQQLELPFVASRVRFMPYSQHTRTVCMRVELYGCPWQQSVLSYTSPRGDSWSDDLRLEDISYDGVLDGELMIGGLGQLIDGKLATDSNTEPWKPDWRWVGWSNETRQGQPVELEFELDGARELTAVHIHALHRPKQGIKVLSEAAVFLSLDGQHYQSAPVQMTMSPGETMQNVSIPLQNRVARFMRLQLFFPAPWILISEVSFDSVSIPRNVSLQILEQMFFQQDSGLMETIAETETAAGETTHARKEVTTATSADSHHQAYIGLLTGVLAMVLLLLLACSVVLMVRRGRKKVALLSSKSSTFVPATGVVGVGSKGGAITMRGLQLSSTPVLARVLGPGARSKVGVAAPPHLANTNGVCSLYGAHEESEDSENSSVYHEPYKLLSSNGNNHQEYGCLLAPSRSAEYTDFTSVNSFQDDVHFPSTPPPPMTSRLEQGCNVTPSAGKGEAFYAATDIVKNVRCEQHLSPGRFTTLRLPNPQAHPDVDSLCEFPRHRLRLVEKMGEGTFGMVLLCEADGVPEFSGLTSSHKKKLVLVKSLWRGCSDKTREEFLHEAEWLSSLRDINVARTLAVCSEEEPLCALQEYGSAGALPNVLREHDPSSISYGCLIYLATQIASGMKYLESLQIIHRDVAARNCLVGQNYSLKVSDHAMFCTRYDHDYYVSDTQARLPIRWMSWESLLLGEYSSKSDVWAFGVALWEVLTLCAHQPFAELSSEQVVENCSHWHLDDGRQRCLARPATCPREVYDLMAECWRRHHADRPRFAEIHLFLQRKNVGYGPSPA